MPRQRHQAPPGGRPGRPEGHQQRGRSKNPSFPARIFLELFSSPRPVDVCPGYVPEPDDGIGDLATMVRTRDRYIDKLSRFSRCGRRASRRTGREKWENFSGVVYKEKIRAKVLNTREKEWSGRRDSNSRPFDPQSNALTRLRYVPIFLCFSKGDWLPRMDSNHN